MRKMRKMRKIGEMGKMGKMGNCRGGFHNYLFGYTQM